ncbi:MAG: indolepyruvate ferredoxin oxidoreductase [Verrucomicrobia bacterium]|nr:indolepyruvate ferredoxin oxidoreductase [Verrucomicrobiota bacterium]
MAIHPDAQRGHSSRFPDLPRTRGQAEPGHRQALGYATEKSTLANAESGCEAGTVKIDPRFTKASGGEVFTGNELLAKGCLETAGGTHLWTGYPGSPVAGFFDTANELQELLRSHGIRATIANNEALGVAMVNGSQMHGLRAIAVQKSVGVHVAADALALGNLVGAHPEGGAVIVLGDDPWSDSTQVPADSRFLAKHLMMPLLEPSDPQELKDWIDLAFQLSRESELYVGYLVTTNQADGGGSVTVRPNQFPTLHTGQPTQLDTAAIDLERNVLLPPRTWRKEQQIGERIGRLWNSARRLGVNRVFRSAQSSLADAGLGFVTCAAAYTYLRHALAELGLDGQFPLLKVGVTYPLDPALVAEFAAGLSDLIVVEERRPFLEEQVLQILQRARQAPTDDRQALPSRVWGKQFPHDLAPIPETRGLNPSKLIDRLGPLFLSWPQLEGRIDRARIQRELDLIREVKSSRIEVVPRTPTFCPGCPHRDSASVLIEIKKQFRDSLYMQRVHGTGPVDLLFHGDTGCYTMLMFEPTKDLMHNYSGMGLGGGTGAGIDPFIRNKQVVFMGDSTFFHSGQLAISNSLKQGQDITYILLDNKTTAMTGHQTTPALAEGLLGEKTFAQNIDAVVAGITDQVRSGATLVRVNPAETEAYRHLLEKAILQPGVKVVVADKECGITFHRRAAHEERRLLRQRGFLPAKRYINITPEVCENCLECTKATGCPGLTLEPTPYGPKVQIDLSWCVTDGACTRFLVSTDHDGPRVKACPSFEEVIVHRTQPPRSPLETLDLSRLSEPPPLKPDRVWHGYLAGVGGMGIGTATAVLVRAGHYEGYQVQFCDKKGLAIRNGGVYSMVSFATPEAPYSSNLIPYGKADLLLGVDLLEAARALDPSTNQRVGSPHYTSAVVNHHKTPTILALLGKSDFDVPQLEDAIRKHLRPGHYFSVNFSDLSVRFFGTQLYANIMLLGTAFQRGYLPLSLASLEQAIQIGLGAAAPANLQAFQVGRLIAHDRPSVHAAARTFREPDTFAEVVADKVALLSRHRARGAERAAAYRQMVEPAQAQLAIGPESLRDFALRVYDLIQFEDPDYARAYVRWVHQIYERDRAEHQFAATRAVIWNLHKVMLIKDEIYVAHLLTSEEKHRRDRARYDIDPARGDRVEYRHLNRPQFTLWGRHLAWNLKTRDWMLDLVKRQKWLRRVLPDWHRPEREFRDWYLGLLPQFNSALGAGPYATFVKVLRLPEAVTGYREIRYPKMTAARAQAELWLRQLNGASPNEARLAAA